MLGGYWLTITAALVIAALLLQQVPLLLVALLFFLTSAVARLWSRYALERLRFQHRLSAYRAFYGETVTLEVSVANEKMLPLPWVHLQEEVPQELGYPRGTILPSYKLGRHIIDSYLSLGWYHRLTRRYPVQCLRRGYFTFGPTAIRSGDLFGFFNNECDDESLAHLVVYPRVVSLESLGISSRDPFGELRARRHLFEDPVRVVTTREYAHGDPLRRIHWKASARQARLQSRVMERTTSIDLALFLDAGTMDMASYGRAGDLLETAIIAAASIASYAIEEGHRVGLYVNDYYRATDRLIRLPPSSHPDQLQRVLEGLAHVQGLPLISLPDLLEKEARSLPWEATLVVITTLPGEGLLARLDRFRRAGRHMALVMVGTGSSVPPIAAVPTYTVPASVITDDMGSMELVEAARTGMP